MDILCPECMTPLEKTNEQAAQCFNGCGKKYQILFSRNWTPAEAAVPSKETAISNATEPAAQVVSEGVMCVNHKEVQAIVKCYICHTAVCETCDFAFPDNLHICPKCAILADEKISKKRKKTLFWSYTLAGLASLFLILFFVASASTSSYEESYNESTLFTYLTLIASITGMILGFTVIDKRLKNPLTVRIPSIWNLFILGTIVLLAIIGTFMAY